MSADNWRVCPKCKKKHDDKLKIYPELIKEKYGKIPQDEWEMIKVEAQQMAAKKIDYTLREDYEIGIFDSGEFFVKYSGRCSNCDFVFSFEHSKNII